MKNKKHIVLIITSISIIIGIFLGFYFIESGWPDRVYNGLRGIDWSMITALILIILSMIIIIISFIHNKKKALEMIVKLYPHNYKMQSKRLILSLIILIFAITLASYSPSISSICMFSFVAGDCVLIILPLYFTNGLYENGVMYSGKFYSWENIISYCYKQDNIITFEIKNKLKEPLEVKFFFKSISCGEIDEIIHRSI